MSQVEKLKEIKSRIKNMSEHPHSPGLFHDQSTGAIVLIDELIKEISNPSIFG